MQKTLSHPHVFNNDMILKKADILEVEARLLEAIKKSDIKVLDQLLHDDLLFIAPNGHVITKEKDLDSHRSGEMRVDELISDIEEIKIIHEIAIAVVVYKTRGTMLGNPINGTFRYIRFWKQSGDALMVIGGSCSQV